MGANYWEWIEWEMHNVTSTTTSTPTSPTTVPTSTPTSMDSADDAVKSEDSLLDQDWILLAVVIPIVFVVGILVGALCFKFKANHSPKEESAPTRGVQMNSMSMDTADGAA